MKLGVCLAFQQDDWDRYESGDFSCPPAVSDAEVYRQNLRAADLIEPLGFDSLFQIEHHGSPHHVTNNPLDILKYMAGRTKRIEMGTCLVVLPWWHPIRLAEEICVLDNFLARRRLHLGVGRGSSPSEYRHLGIDMSTGTQRFTETIDILRAGLSQPCFSHHGEIYNFENATIRPRPLHSDLADYLYAGATQPSSIERCARSGLKLMHSGGSTFEEGAAAVDKVNLIREELNLPPMRPIIMASAFCSEDSKKAEEVGRKTIGEYFRSALKNYRYDDQKRFANVKGYEDYAKSGTPSNDAHSFIPTPAQDKSVDPNQAAADAYVQSGIIGTPDACIAKIARLARLTKTDHLVLLVNHRGSSFDDTEESMRLLASKVLPAVRQLNAQALGN